MHSAQDIRDSLKLFEQRRRMRRNLRLYRTGFWLMAAACLVIWYTR